MNRGGVLLVAVVLAAAPACGLLPGSGPGAAGCTMIGCDSQVMVRVADMGLKGEAGLVTAEMCFDQVCDQQEQRFKPDGASFGRQRSNLDVDAFGDSVELTLRLPDADYDETTTHRVSIKVSVDGGKPVTVEREVTLQRSQPNGENCEPVCWQAAIKV